MKEYLDKVINVKTQEAEDIRSKVKNATTENSSADEVRALGETLDKVLAELNEAKEARENLEEPANEEPRAEGEEETPVEENPDEETPAEEEPEEEPRAEETEEKGEPTSEDVQRSAEWTKVDANNLKQVASFEQRGGNKMETKEMEKLVEARAKDLLEGRAITVASSDILLPKHQSSDLATAPFRQVSTFVDLTNIKNLQGGESYEEPFVISYGEGGLTEEGGEYAEAETVFGKAEINKVKITAYAEFSEETEKLPAADYEKEIRNGVELALKKKLAQQQITGAGTANTFTGIMSTDASNVAVLASDDLELSGFDQDTLNKIIFAYGGDEEVEQAGYLVLNKSDLLALSLVRNEIGDHAYTIDLAKQTINTVPYVINSNCKALTGADTAEGEYTMFYGIPKHYTTSIFSPVEIKKSYDYKFREGMIAYRASVFAGGNTTSYRGFIRVKKGAAVGA